MTVGGDLDGHRSVVALCSHHVSLRNYIKQWEKQEHSLLDEVMAQVQNSTASSIKPDRVNSVGMANKDDRPMVSHKYSSESALSVVSETESRCSSRMCPLGELKRPAFYTAQYPSVDEECEYHSGGRRKSERKRPSGVLGNVESFNRMCSQLKMSVGMGHQPSSSAKSHQSQSSSGRKRITFSTTGSMKPQLMPAQPGPREKLQEFLESTLFETVSCFIVIVNAIFLNLNAQRLIDHGTQLSDFNEGIEWGFCCFYVIELGLRIFAPGLRSYFSHQNFSWKFFDLILVGTVVFERFAALYGSMSSSGYISLRNLRVLKCVQCCKAIRILRVFRELRMIASTILGSVKTLIWSLVLMVLITATFGTCFLQATANYVVDSPESETKSDVLKYWGTLPKSMRSLYMAVTGGDDWKNLSKPLEEVGSVADGMFMFYIGVYSFVILNTLVSLFVAATFTNKQEDDLQLIVEELKQKERHVRHFTTWFQAFDKDFSGDVSMDEFNAVIEEPGIEAFAARMGLDIFDMRQFFTVLSGGGKYLVNLERFVVGCIKLKGNAKSLDLMELMYWQSKGMEDHLRFEHQCLKRMATLTDEVREIGSQFQALHGRETTISSPAETTWPSWRDTCSTQATQKMMATTTPCSDKEEGRYRLMSSDSFPQIYNDLMEVGSPRLDARTAPEVESPMQDARTASIAL